MAITTLSQEVRTSFRHPAMCAAKILANGKETPLPTDHRTDLSPASISNLQAHETGTRCKERSGLTRASGGQLRPDESRDSSACWPVRSCPNWFEGRTTSARRYVSP